MMLLYCCSVILLSTLCLANAGCPGVVSRKSWDALDPIHVRYNVRPVRIVIIQHTATESCSTDRGCKAMMQSIQNYHMDDLQYWDIGSSFYVGGNGKVYEGTGWLHEGAHTYGFNNRSIGISFIGNYNTNTPTDAQMGAVKSLIECGVREGHLTQNYHVVGHKQLISSESPGRKIYNIIRRWPEFLEDVTSIKKIK